MKQTLLQHITDSAQYKIGYSIGGWIPFLLLGIALTLMVLQLRKRNRRDQQP
jgi:hypothetical protein